MVDENGLPVRLLLTPGQTHDSRPVPALLSSLAPGATVVADRAYDADAILALIASCGANAQIPTPRYRKQQRSVDKALYRQRNLVERFFCNIKQFRRIATRFDKLARNFLAAACLAATRLWTRYESTP